VQSWTAAGSKIQQKIQPQRRLPQTEICFLIYIHREISKFKQSVLTLVSPVSSSGIRNNNIICITPTMILYEDMKPIEHVLLHPICVLSHLMCACKHCDIKLSLYYWTHWSCWWMYCCDRKSRAAYAQSFALWQQATIEFTCHDHSPRTLVVTFNGSQVNISRASTPRSLLYCLFAPHICMVLFFTHNPFVVNHTINATPPERLQQYSII